MQRIGYDAAMGQDQHVPYRPMPRAYLAFWVAVNILLAASNSISRYGWPPESLIAFLVGVGIGGTLGGLLFGWLLWRFWLYRKFPPK